ncbi:MAG: glycosyltransferase family 4 protein [Candidatus Eisenbacteria bacterium]
MKILFLCSALTYGGTFVRCQELAKELGRRGHAVTVVKISERSRVRTEMREINGIRVLEMPRFWGMRWFGNDRLPSDILARMGHLLTNRYDVIHLFSHHLSGYLPWRAAKTFKRASLFVNDWDDLWTDGGWFGDLENPGVPRLRYRMEAWLEKHARLDAGGVTAISRALLDRTVSLGIPKERTLYLPAGADVENITLVPQDEARRALGLDLQGIMLVYSGFTVPDRDLTTMLTALSIVRQRLPVKLLLSGLASGIVEAKRKDLGLAEDAIVHLGFVPMPGFARFLAAGDIALLPLSDSKTNRFRFPNKFGDYLAAGRPIVASAVGEVGHFMKSYPVGLLADGSPEDFAEKIMVLAKDASLRRQCSRAARGVAENVLSWRIHSANLEAFYSKLQASDRGRAQ